MLIVLVGGDEDTADGFAEELSKRVDFKIVMESPEELFTGTVASYKANNGEHIVAYQHHWRELFDKERYKPTHDFKLSELHLASRGGITVLLDDDPLTDVISRESINYMEAISPEDAISLARNLELEVIPLERWRTYIGKLYPLKLVVCRPDRAVRMEVIDKIPEDEWQDVGIVSSAVSPAELDLLWMTLRQPELIGFESLPPMVENWIASRGGQFGI